MRSMRASAEEPTSGAPVARQGGSRRRPDRAWLPALAVSVASAATILLRLRISSPQPYGVHGGEYGEHAQRLYIVGLWRADEPSGLLDFVAAADNAYPPLLDILTAAMGGLLGHRAEDVVWTSIGWLALLAASIAWGARSLGARPATAAAAWAATWMLPVLHASATRYYFDLPMSALCWLSLACLLAAGRADREPRRFALAAAAGAVLTAACMVKWTALPFGLIMLGAAGLAALLSPAADGEGSGAARHARRVAPAVVSVVVLAIGVRLFLGLSHSSLDAMSTTFLESEPPGGLLGWIASVAPGPLRGPLHRAALQAPELPLRLIFYALRGTFTLYSPLLALPIAAGCALWVARHRGGIFLLGTIAVGHVGFVALCVPIADERFLTTAAPLPVLAAVLGWSTLDVRPRRAVAVVTALAAAWVAWDFHFDDSDRGAPRDVLWYVEFQGDGAQVTHAGLGLESSGGDRGWVRRDEERDHRLAFREALWRAAEGCEASHLALTHDLIVNGADKTWWTYRELLDRLDRDSREGTRQTRRVDHVCQLPPDSAADLVLFVAMDESAPALPECLGEVRSAWRYEGFVPDPDGGPGAGVWTGRERPACGPLSGSPP
jgi:hypothetical protein